MDEINLNFEKYSVRESSNKSRMQLWIIVIVLALSLIAFIIYRTCQWTKSGKLQESIKLSKKNKKNKGYWNAGDIG